MIFEVVMNETDISSKIPSIYTMIVRICKFFVASKRIWSVCKIYKLCKEQICDLIHTHPFVLPKKKEKGSPKCLI